MKLSRLIIPIPVGRLLTVGTLVAYASGRAAPSTPPVFHASETNLPPASFADHIAADATGRLWITESLSRTLVQFDPVTHAYTCAGYVAHPCTFRMYFGRARLAPFDPLCDATRI